MDCTNLCAHSNDFITDVDFIYVGSLGEVVIVGVGEDKSIFNGSSFDGVWCFFPYLFAFYIVSYAILISI